MYVNVGNSNIKVLYILFLLRKSSNEMDQWRIFQPCLIWGTLVVVSFSGEKNGGCHLVGGIPTPLKNMSSSVGIIIPNIWKKMFQTTNQSCILFTSHSIWWHARTAAKSIEDRSSIGRAPWNNTIRLADMPKVFQHPTWNLRQWRFTAIMMWRLQEWQGKTTQSQSCFHFRISEGTGPSFGWFQI